MGMKIKYTGMELKLHRHGIPIALASVFGAMLTATPLVSDSALANGIVMGKVFWFHLSMVLMAIGTIVTIGFGGKKSVSFSLPDGLLLLFAGVTLATYDWQLGPEPEKLLFGGQLIVLWFLLRYFLTEVPCLKFFFSVHTDAHRTGRSRLGNAAIAWPCLFPSFAFPADGFFL